MLWFLRDAARYPAILVAVTCERRSAFQFGGSEPRSGRLELSLRSGDFIRDIFLWVLGPKSTFIRRKRRCDALDMPTGLESLLKAERRGCGR